MGYEATCLDVAVHGFEGERIAARNLRLHSDRLALDQAERWPHTGRLVLRQGSPKQDRTTKHHQDRHEGHGTLTRRLCNNEIPSNVFSRETKDRGGDVEQTDSFEREAGGATPRFIRSRRQMEGEL